MKSAYYFLLGMWEFRLSVTTDPGDYGLEYDRGRELAHVLTFRHFEE